MPTQLEERNTELENQKLEQEIVFETNRARVSELELKKVLRGERNDAAMPDRTRTLNLFDAVTPDLVDRALILLMKWEARDPGCPITVNINTPGGSITDGLALFDYLQHLRRKGHHVTTRGMGMAASMGSVLIQAGDVRIMDARAKMLIHKGSMSVQGSMNEIEDRMKLSEMLREDLFEILAERSNLSKEEIIDKAERRDWWFGAQEALDMGFVDRVE